MCFYFLKNHFLKSSHIYNWKLRCHCQNHFPLWLPIPSTTCA